MQADVGRHAVAAGRGRRGCPGPRGRSAAWCPTARMLADRVEEGRVAAERVGGDEGYVELLAAGGEVGDLLVEIALAAEQELLDLVVRRLARAGVVGVDDLLHGLALGARPEEQRDLGRGRVRPADNQGSEQILVRMVPLPRGRAAGPAVGGDTGGVGARRPAFNQKLLISTLSNRKKVIGLTIAPAPGGAVRWQPKRPPRRDGGGRGRDGGPAADGAVAPDPPARPSLRRGRAACCGADP